jgi:hypothetical protein
MRGHRSAVPKTSCLPATSSASGVSVSVPPSGDHSPPPCVAAGIRYLPIARGFVYLFAVRRLAQSIMFMDCHSPRRLNVSSMRRLPGLVRRWPLPHATHSPAVSAPRAYARSHGELIALIRMIDDALKQNLYDRSLRRWLVGGSSRGCNGSGVCRSARNTMRPTT